MPRAQGKPHYRAAAILALAACGRDAAPPTPGGPAGAVRVFVDQPNAYFEEYFSAALISPDGRRAAYTGIPGFARFLDLESGRDVAGETLPEVSVALAAAFGPNGEWAVAGPSPDGFGWFIKDPGGRQHLLPIPPDATPVWDPAGKRVAFLRSWPAVPDSVFVGPVDSIRGYKLASAATGLGWLPDGSGLLLLETSVSGSSSLVKLDLASGRSASLVDGLDAPWGPPPPFAVAPNGRHVFIALAGTGAPDQEARNLPVTPRRLGLYEVDLETGARQVVVPPSENGDAFAPAVAGENLFWTTTQSSLSIVVLPATGGSAQEVVNGAFAPSWHPGGRQIGFAYGDWRWADFPLNWDGGVIAVDTGGRAAGALTPLIVGYHEDFPPVWSPDGKWIAYHSHRSKAPVAAYFLPGATDDIWLKRAGAPARDTSEIRLTDFGWEAGSPSWSRDGSRMTFSSFEAGGQLGLYFPYYVRIDTTTGRPLESGRLKVPAEIQGVIAAAWSPVNDDLALEQDQNGRRALWVVPASGTPPRRVVEYTSRVLSGWAWTSDGAGLIYSAATPERYQLFVVPVAGGAPRQVTSDSANLMHPSMSPDGRLIAATRLLHRKEIWRMPIPEGGRVP